MKYLNKEPFSSGGNSKNFRNNYDKIDWKESKKDFVKMDIDLDDEQYDFVQREAEKNNLTFNDALVKMVEKGLELLQNEEEKE